MPNITAIFHAIADWFRFDGKSAAGEGVSFGQGYKAFKGLLTANNHALELMAEMEQALASGRPFGMALVRGTCTALSVNVYKMILHLQVISDNRYPGLLDTFREITAEIEAIVQRKPLVAHGEWVLPMSAVDRRMVDMVGEKMANLGEIRNRVGLKTPEGFVVTAAASEYFMAAGLLQDEINRRLQSMAEEELEALYQTSSAIQQLIINAPLPADLARAIMAHYRQLREAAGREVLVSMRSSALGEDRGSVSFAGQYRTQLHVAEEFILRTYKEIVAGKYKSQAIVYRMQRGFRHQDVIMCVGCLEMVDAVTSGVIYSRSPTNPRSDWLEIMAVAGLANQVVDGNVATDYFRVSRSPSRAVIHRQIRLPDQVPGSAPGPKVTLSDNQAGELARVGIRLEEHFGAPQDIEWSIDRQGMIVILQSRPLSVAEARGGTSVGVTEPPDDALVSGGITASPGVASGPVCMVRSTVELLQFPPGAVLVVAHPLPEWATLLSRAVAVVSESGQAAAHLATVAREFGIPALFGAAGATSKLTAKAVVTVDATGCRVYPGLRQALLDQGAEPPPNLMAASPIHALLTEVLRRVTPLNLTDPGALTFTPAACQTLHDLTRFCHEKAVTEMFSFGSRHGVDEKSAKQLVGETPYQWWVIDLDDGFAPGFDKRERFIPIDAIVSPPMKAIWQGMTRIPWAGPPPMDLAGFGSIIFRSTMNRHLEPSVRSALSERNYFMVSRNFCNLCVRLGYHFSLVEAHVSEFLTENYISFQFKGGAADEQRRLARVRLIGEILGRYGFRVEQKGDALTARIEKRPAPYLLPRLQVLGYLLMHTRQIDMVMGDREMVDHYRHKIGEDLAGMVPAAEEREGL